MNNFKDAFPVGILCIDAKVWGREKGCQSHFHDLAHLLCLTHFRYQKWLDCDLVLRKIKKNVKCFSGDNCQLALMLFGWGFLAVTKKFLWRCSATSQEFLHCRRCKVAKYVQILLIASCKALSLMMRAASS